MCASVINWNWHERLMARLHATTTTDSRGYHRVYLESQLVHFIFLSCPSCALAEWSSWAFFTCLLTPLASQKVLVQCGHSFLAAVVAFSPSITDHWSKMQCMSCALCMCACMHASHAPHPLLAHFNACAVSLSLLKFICFSWLLLFRMSYHSTLTRSSQSQVSCLELSGGTSSSNDVSGCINWDTACSRSNFNDYFWNYYNCGMMAITIVRHSGVV